jgi:tetratricopeptide (TPR) repeat protein
MKRALCLVSIGIFVLIGSAGLSGSEAVDFTVEEYAELVHRYLQGDYTGAGRALSKVSVEQALEAADEYMTRWVVDPQIKAAALIHTDVALSAGGAEPTPHIEAARKWMQMLEESGRQSFESRWYLVLGYSLQGELRLGDAGHVLETALRAFPDDIEVRKAYATLSETAGWIQEESKLLKEARKQYRIILETEPDDAEMHVRLGRVLTLLGQGDEAMAELSWGIEAADKPEIQLAAFLILGDLYEDRGEHHEAVRFYRQALGTDPDCQSAAISLAHGLHKAGDASGSYHVLEQFLAARERSHKNERGDENQLDLWWRFLLGNSDRFDVLLQELRSEI